MVPTFIRVSSLLVGIGTLLLGTGLLGTLLGVRGGMEQFSAPLVGAIMATYFLGYVSGAWLCPPLVRRVGHIRAFSAMAATACACALLHGMLVDPAVWLGLRYVMGACQMGLYLVVESWLNAQTESRTRGTTFSLYMAVILFALGGGQFLLLPYGAGELASFALAAVFCALGLVPVALTRMVEPAAAQAAHLHLRELVRASPLGTFGALATGLSNGAFWGLGALFAQRIGLDDPGIAAFMASVIIGGAILQIPIGHLSDTRDRRTVLGAAALVSVAAALGTALLIGRSFEGLLACAALYGGFSFSVYSLAVAHTNDLLDPARALETARGLLLLNGIGATLGPLLGGVAMQELGPVGLLYHIAAALAALAAFAWYHRHAGAGVPVAQQAEFVAMARAGPVVLEMDPRVEAATEPAAGGGPPEQPGAVDDLRAAS